MLIFYPQSLTNADILGQGNLNLVSEKSGKSQGILLSIICGNPVKEGHIRIIPVKLTFEAIVDDLFVFLFVFVALCPKSTAMVMAGRSVHLTTLFHGQA